MTGEGVQEDPDHEGFSRWGPAPRPAGPRNHDSPTTIPGVTRQRVRRPAAGQTTAGSTHGFLGHADRRHLGWTFGGPLGAMLGAAIGSSMSRSGRVHTYSGQRPGAPPPPPRSHAGRAEERRVAFFVATFGVMGHIGQRGRPRQRGRSSAARDVMTGLGLDAQDRNLAGRIFNQGKSPRFALDDALTQLVQVAGRRPQPASRLRGDPVQGRVGGRQCPPRGTAHPGPHRGVPRLLPRRDGADGTGRDGRHGAPAGQPEEKLKEAYGVLGAERSRATARSVPRTGGSWRQHHPTGWPPRAP